MTNIEIPLVKDRDWLYRFFEMIPGLLELVNVTAAGRFKPDQPDIGRLFSLSLS